MATDDTEICNLALDHIGERATIPNLSEVSAEAEACNRWYAKSLNEILTAQDWGFARKRTLLVQHNECAPDGVWAYRHILPPDLLVVRKVQNPNSPPDDASPYDIELAQASTTQITAATVANPVVLTVTAHGLSNTAQVRVTGVTGMVELNNRDFLVANVAANTVELQDLSSVNIDGTGFAAFTTQDANPCNGYMSHGALTRTLLSNVGSDIASSNAILVYTMNFTLTTLFPDPFTRALSHLIASKIAFGLTGKRPVMVDQARAYANTLRLAATHDANEVVDEAPREAEWIRARDGNPQGKAGDTWRALADAVN